MRLPIVPLMLGASFVLATVASPVASAQNSVWSKPTTNLQVLPESISGDELNQIMRTFTQALGVRCEYCHAAEPGQSFNEVDYAKDGLEAKEAARTMLKMVSSINKDYIAQLAGHAGSPNSGGARKEHSHVSVTCITCHRGRAIPAMLEDILVETTLAAGVDSAITRYRDLRDEYYGGFAFDFREGTLADVAEMLVESEEVDAALAIMNLELEINGESSRTLAALASVQAEAGKNDDAIRTLERAIEIAAGNEKRGLERQLSRLKQ